jgi:hypothetical protein
MAKKSDLYLNLSVMKDNRRRQCLVYTNRRPLGHHNYRQQQQQQQQQIHSPIIIILISIEEFVGLIYHLLRLLPKS